MSSNQIEREFLSEITDALIAKCVCLALRKEHADIYSAMKQIERVTGISASTAANWYKGRYAPKASHLLKLATCYPGVLHELLKLMGMEQLSQQAVAADPVKQMRGNSNKMRKHPSTIGDKFVPIHVRVQSNIAVQLNKRQLWFLGQLQNEATVVASDIVRTWHVHAKTAHRDLKDLIAVNLIFAEKDGRSYRFHLKPSKG